MAENKKVYVHFERNDYIGGKTELLKTQMEILYLKKVLKNLAITREKKKHYQIMLKETLLNLKTKLINLDNLMPIDEEMIRIRDQNKRQESKEFKQKKQEKILDNAQPSKKNDIEEELLKIKQKLDRLNSI